MSALHLADGPAMYLGGSMMSFALPLAAFIVIAPVLYFLYRRPHHGPRLKYLRPEAVTSLQTWEPGPIPAPPARAEPGTAAGAAATPATEAAATEAAATEAAGEEQPGADETGEPEPGEAEGNESEGTM